MGDRIWQQGEREARDRLQLMPRLSASLPLSIATVSSYVAWRQGVWIGEASNRVSQRGYPVLGARLDSELYRFFGELRQVMSNLMLNSLDALGEGGRVTLRASKSRSPVDGSSRIRITVADNGQGISLEALPRIFEPFFTTKGLTGNGLGLWVGKQIIEKHGGSIRVRSRTCAPQGTTFSMVLPECAPNPISV